jgi:predicted metal-dependent enzyme (double-stranded beta helix superfamily)
MTASPDDTPYDLTRYVRDVGALFDRGLDLEERVRLIAQCKRRLVNGGQALPARLNVPDPTAPYTRNLAHVDPAGRFVVIVLVWGAYQETTIHDHSNWCVVGVHAGTAHVTDYDRLDDESNPDAAELIVRGSSMAFTGAVLALLPPSRSNIHKMANASRAPMLSIHTYGDPGTRANVFHLKSGTREVMELKFHNVPEGVSAESVRLV